MLRRLPAAAIFAELLSERILPEYSLGYELTGLKRGGEPLTVLLADHSIYRLEADLRWIDHTAARLDTLSKAVQQ